VWLGLWKKDNFTGVRHGTAYIKGKEGKTEKKQKGERLDQKEFVTTPGTFSG